MFHILKSAFSTYEELGDFISSTSLEQMSEELQSIISKFEVEIIIEKACYNSNY